MARASVATKPKKKVIRAVRRGGGMFALMPTDNWHRAKHFVHYDVESKEAGSMTRDYIKKNFDKKVYTAISKLPDTRINNYSHWACTAAMLERNPDIVPEAYKEGIVKWVNQLVEESKQIVEEKKAEESEKKKAYVPSIQERITEQAQNACEAIEEWLDGFVNDKKNFDPKGFNFTGHFANMKVSQAHARKIKGYYERELNEAREVVNMPTPQQISKIKDEREKDYAQQLREGYAHLSKKDAKSYLEALENLVGACDLVIESSKATRKPRVRKAPSVDKLVSKLKYKATDNKYQIASVNPVEIINSTEIWVFNTKTRKLGKYVADELQRVMTIKGTGIIGYDENKSVQKTLRKPEETLKEFKSAGKVKLRTFLENIKTTDVKLNGRLNSDTIILKVFQ